MKTQSKPSISALLRDITLECGSPEPYFKDDWQAVAFNCSLKRDGKTFWQGQYKMGIGHFTPTKKEDPDKNRFIPWLRNLPSNEEQMLRTWLKKPHASFVNKELQATVAAKLAKMRKQTPELEDVLSSVMLDGSPFFDAERFEDWAGEYGYSPDSIKAKEIFDVCDKTGREVARVFSPEEIQTLREWSWER